MKMEMALPAKSSEYGIFLFGVWVGHDPDES